MREQKENEPGLVANSSRGCYFVVHHLADPDEQPVEENVIDPEAVPEPPFVQAEDVGDDEEDEQKTKLAVDDTDTLLDVLFDCASTGNTSTGGDTT